MHLSLPISCLGRRRWHATGWGFFVPLSCPVLRQRIKGTLLDGSFSAPVAADFTGGGTLLDCVFSAPFAADFAPSAPFAADFEPGPEAVEKGRATGRGLLF